MSTQAQSRPTLSEPSPHARRVLLIFGVVFLVAAAALVLLLWLVKRHHTHQVQAAHEHIAEEGPSVSVIHVQTSATDRELTLEGTVRGYEQTTLYAKISGYLKEMRVERGDHVAAGQILGIIESPENDQDVIAARADADTKRRNAERARLLVVPGVISKIDEDQAESAHRQAQAELQRLNVVRAYETVRAPFAGVVTGRYVDAGALLPAATSGTTSAQPLVDLASVDRVRVFLYVGQDVAAFLKPGDPVTIWQDELPERQIAAAITRMTQALDQRSRRMQCEVDVDNRAVGLLPGTSVHVRVGARSTPSPYVPNEALSVRNGKTQVALVNQKKLHFVDVELASTDGLRTRVLRGLSGGETVALDLPIDLEEGATIRPIESEKTEREQAGNAPQTKSAGSQPPSDADRGSSTQERAQNVGSGNNPRRDSAQSTLPAPAGSGR